MTNFIAGLAATFIMLPFVVYILFFILIKQMTHNHKKAVQMAMDISTIFFVFSVHYLISVIWELQLFWILLVVLLCIAIFVVLLHYKIKGEIVFGKIMKGFWRVSFAFFLLIYIGLVTYGLIQRIVQSFS